MNLNIEKQFELAKRVMPQFTWAINEHDGRVYTLIGGEDCDNVVFFYPKLNGVNSNKADALDVIVAAFDLGHGVGMFYGSGTVPFGFPYENKVASCQVHESHQVKPFELCSDILQASILALLAVDKS